MTITAGIDAPKARLDLTKPVLWLVAIGLVALIAPSIVRLLELVCLTWLARESVNARPISADRPGRRNGFDRSNL